MLVLYKIATHYILQFRIVCPFVVLLHLNQIATGLALISSVFSVILQVAQLIILWSFRTGSKMIVLIAFSLLIRL